MKSTLVTLCKEFSDGSSLHRFPSGLYGIAEEPQSVLAPDVASMAWTYYERNIKRKTRIGG